MNSMAFFACRTSKVSQTTTTCAVLRRMQQQNDWYPRNSIHFFSIFELNIFIEAENAFRWYGQQLYKEFQNREWNSFPHSAYTNATSIATICQAKSDCASLRLKQINKIKWNETKRALRMISETHALQPDMNLDSLDMGVRGAARLVCRLFGVFCERIYSKQYSNNNVAEASSYFYCANQLETI